MSRPMAEIIPVLAEPPKPNGLPMANTQSPTRDFSSSPQGKYGKSLASFNFNKARSVLESLPLISASYSVPSVKVTTISSARSMT